MCLALGDYLNVQATRFCLPRLMAEVHVCIGGKRVSDDIHTFEAGVQIVCPGLSLKFILISY